MRENPDVLAVLDGYADFRLCREMGWTPQELMEQPADIVQRFHMFLAAENEAKAKIREREAREAKRGGRQR